MKNLFKEIITKIITWQASFLLKKHKPKIIAITGNLGKTTTKDFITAALKKNLISEKGDYLVLASKKSMNSEIGIPLTILGLESGWTNPWLWLKIIFSSFVKMFDTFPYKYLVLEIGADSPGDILKVSKYIKPDIVVLTAFAKVPVHIEFFDNDREKLIREKKYLAESLKEGGTLIYNLDDIDCQNIAKDLENKNINFQTFSLKSKEADIIARNTKVLYEDKNRYISKIQGISGEIVLKEEVFRIELLEVLGDAAFYGLLPALLIANDLNISLEKDIKDIEKSDKPKGRMRVFQGLYESTIIDDTYNSSPKALKHGIEIIKNLKTRGKKIFVLGDMLELGDFTKREHEEIGKRIAKVCDILIVSGIRAKIIGETALEEGMSRDNVYITPGSLEAARQTLLTLETEVEKDYKQGRTEKEVGGDLVFVKGSQGARMEKVVRMIIDRNLYNPDEELVRQEKIWGYK